MVKCIIVEDDPRHSERLVSLLKHFDSLVEVEKVCEDLDSAKETIITLRPKLVFLDIMLQGDKHAGFELLKKVRSVPFEVIFTTAYVDDNIQEIRLSGLDYIHKPYILEEVQDALEKYLFLSSSGWHGQKTKGLKANLLTEDLSHRTVWIANGNSYEQIRVGNIIYCESDNQYTVFHIKGKKHTEKQYVSCTGIGRWEKDLRRYGFCRIHRRYLVNLKAVARYVKGEGGMVILANGQHLDVSRSGKAELMRMAGIGS